MLFAYTASTMVDQNVKYTTRKKSYFVKKIIKHITPNFKLKQDDLEGKTGFLRDTT